MASYNILILGGGILQTPLIQEAKKKGLFTIVVDKNPSCEGRKYADLFWEISTQDKEKIQEAISSFPKKIHLCATMGTDVSDVVGEICEKLKIFHINKEQGLISTHKGKMRDFLQKKGFFTPKYFYTSSKKEAYHWLRENSFPHGFLIKPVKNMGARGVLFLQDPEEISYAWEYAQKYSPSGEVLLEEFLEGEEISVDALVFQGKVYFTGIAKREIILHQEKYPLEIGHFLPYEIEEKRKKLLKELFEKFSQEFSSLGEAPYCGALKGDIKWHKGKWVILEMASRPSGGFMSMYTYPLATGKNLARWYLEILMHRLPDDIGEREKYLFYTAEKNLLTSPGILKKLSYPSSLVEFSYIRYQEGSFLPLSRSNVDKIAHFIFKEKSYEDLQKKIEDFFSSLEISIETPILSWREIQRFARKNFHKDYCWVCKECDGKNCASSIPGMGGIGKGKLFAKNYSKLQEISILPRYLKQEKKEDSPNTSYQLFHEEFSAPIFPAPITGSKTNMGGSITEMEYRDSILWACKKLKLLPTFGDGGEEDKFLIGLYAIKEYTGIPIFKPRPLEELYKRIEYAQKLGSSFWGVDIDALYFKTLERKKQKTQSLSLKDLQDLKKAFPSMYMVLKGILSKEDADIALEGGADILIISNHGGRILESLPATVEVLPSLSSYIRKKNPRVKVWVDGGIRSGEDVFKMLSLGAEATLIGRPVVIAAVANREIGVYSLLKGYIEDLKRVMKVLGLSSLEEVYKRGKEFLEKNIL